MGTALRQAATMLAVADARFDALENTRLNMIKRMKIDV